MGRIAPDLVVQDAVIPRTRLPEVLATIHQISERWQVQVCNVFHAGDGNLHPNIPYNSRDAEQTERVHHAMREIMRACLEVGGSLTGEHGIGIDKLEYMPLSFSPESLNAMCQLRDAFDPARRANPGKVVPVRSCREWTMAPSARRRSARDLGLGTRDSGAAGPSPASRVPTFAPRAPRPALLEVTTLPCEETTNA